MNVMVGTYVESIEIDKPVTLLAGFDYTTFSARTPWSSVIDADGMDKVVNIRDAAPVTVDGFTLTGGRTGGEGGGIGISNATVFIVDNLIEDNAAGTDAEEYGQGGGIYASGSSTILAITGNTIRGNIASLAGTGGAGGGMLLDEVASATIVSNTISANTAVLSGSGGSGGGIVLAGVGELTFADNRISENVALLNGQSAEDPQRVEARGGGVDIGGGDIENETFIIRNNQIISNTAVQSATVSSAGAAIDIFGGGLAIRDVATLSVDGNTIAGNQLGRTVSMTGDGIWAGTTSGGGVHIHNSSVVTVSDNLFSANFAAEQQQVNDAGAGSEGGAMRVIDVAKATLTGNTFSGNAAVASGSISASTELNYYPSGGAIQFSCWSSSPCAATLNGNLFSQNAAARSFSVGGDKASGGGYGGALSIGKQSIDLSGNVFTDNMGRTSGSGGGNGGGVPTSTRVSCRCRAIVSSAIWAVTAVTVPAASNWIGRP